jgi:ribosomal protein S18 acetylase RimI-like enzyme
MSDPAEAHFRPAVAADVERLLGFMREFYAHEGLLFQEPAARAAVLGLLREPSAGRVYLIEVGGSPAGRTPVGYAVLTLGYSLAYQGRDAFIDELYLDPAHRGRGLGRQTVAFLTETCRALEVRALHLEVERVNAPAQQLYLGTGFEGHDRALLTKWIRRPEGT